MSRERKLPGSQRYRFKLQTRAGPFHTWITRSYKHKDTRDKKAQIYRERGWSVISWNLEEDDASS